MSRATASTHILWDAYMRAAPSPHKTTAAAPFYDPPLHESTLLAPPTTSRGAPVVGPSARAPCAPAAPPPAGPPPAQGPAPPPVATPTLTLQCWHVTSQFQQG